MLRWREKKRLWKRVWKREEMFEESETKELEIKISKLSNTNHFLSQRKRRTQYAITNTKIITN